MSLSGKQTLALSTCALWAGLTISLLPTICRPLLKTRPEINNPPHLSRNGLSRALMLVESRCDTVGKEEIMITCDYVATPDRSSEDSKATRIVLNRIMISFRPTDESHMHLDLTLTNESMTRLSDSRTPYLVIDDDAGQNHVRRLLPQVDFRKIAPGQRLTFSNWLLVGAFRPGHYTIYLWIPDADPSLKFSAAHNFLLSSVGVANPQTGLNTLAGFTVMP
jgi:hypothetical protein